MGRVLSINQGIIWRFIEAVVICIYNILNRKLSNDGYKAIEIVTYSMIFAIFILSPFNIGSLKELKTASFLEIASVVGLGVFSSAIAYYMWSKAISIVEKQVM